MTLTHLPSNSSWESSGRNKVLYYLLGVLSATSPSGVRNYEVAAAIEVGQVLVPGRNSRKTSPFQLRYGRNPYSIHLHAEIEALSRATRLGKDITGSSLYVLRVLRNGTLAPALPCEGCMRALLSFGVKRVYYS